jgi:hypothetical protein
MLTGIISILGGVIAASSYIVSKKANAKELIDKLIPYQGWIGVVLLFWSIKNVLRLLNYFNGYTLLFAVAQFIVGFLLAYGLLSQYLFKNSEEAIEKGQQLRVKLIQYQVPAGVGLIILGVLRLIQWL